jgi:ABC-type antimicrobial peptide transport system permease subunit
MALGEQPRRILVHVLSDGLVIATEGVVAGLLIGFIAARLIVKYTTEMQMPGLLPLVASALLILAAAVIASALPAARASRINAVQALRSE